MTFQKGFNLDQPASIFLADQKKKSTIERPNKWSYLKVGAITLDWIWSSVRGSRLSSSES
jgi:hypothetical protein